MNSLDAQYMEILANAKGEAESDRQKAEKLPGYIEPGSGVKWGFRLAQYDERPIVEVSCSHCGVIMRTEQLDFEWKHCGVKSVVPAELNARLKAIQIKQGRRKADNWVRELFKPEPSPALNNF